MRVAAEAVVELADLLVQHRVPHHAEVEFLPLLRVRQVTVKQQIAYLKEVGVLGELFDGIAAIQQDTFVAVDVGDLALARRCSAVSGIEGEDPEVAVQLADVGYRRSYRCFQQRQVGRLVGAIHCYRYGPLCRTAHVRVPVAEEVAAP